VFETGESFEVGIQYHSPGPLKGVRFSLEFLREDGVLAFSSMTDDDEMRSAVLPAGGIVRFRVDRLPLLDGLFRAGVTITDIESEEPYTVLVAAFPFRVRNVKLKERGVALIGHVWSLPTEIASGGAKRAG
jgi:hypothetical protein